MAEYTPQEQMYYDPAEFDFASLMDGVETIGIEGGRVDSDKKLADRFAQKGKEYMKEKGADITGFDDFDGIDDDAEPWNPNNDVSDLETPEPAGYSEEVYKVFEAIEEDTPVPVGNGRTLTKAQMRELAEAKEQIEEGNNFYKTNIAQFQEHNERIRRALNENLTETDITIHQIQNKMNHPSTPPSQKGELYDALQFQLGKKQRIVNSVNETEQARRVHEDNNLNYQIRESDNTMKRLYGNQYDPDGLFAYAQSRGMSIPAIRNGILHGGPVFVQMMMESMLHGKDQESQRSRVRESMVGVARSKQINTKKDLEHKSNNEKRKQDALKNMGANPAAAFEFLDD